MFSLLTELHTTVYRWNPLMVVEVPLPLMIVVQVALVVGYAVVCQGTRTIVVWFAFM
jgi:hypothetical protein